MVKSFNILDLLEMISHLLWAALGLGHAIELQVFKFDLQSNYLMD